MVLYMNTDTAGAKPRPRTIAQMKADARRVLRGRGIDPDGIASQADVAADLGLPDPRSVSWLRQQYKGPDGTRGRDLEPFPAPAKVVGGGRGNPVWWPRWEPLAWHLTRPQTHLPEETTDHA